MWRETGELCSPANEERFMPTELITPALQVQKFSVKIPVKTGADVPLETFVPILHRWIQTQSLSDHLLVDVADYRHVVEGPGVLLVSHESNMHIDETDGERGLLYVRKMPLPGSFAKRIGTVIGYALGVANKLEHEPELAGKLAFHYDRLTLRLNDRLRAPNTADTFAATREDLTAAIGGSLGSTTVTIEHLSDLEQAFGVRAAS